MISKKAIAPALAGTGAVGATGSLAWALGLFDGEGLDDAAEAQKAQTNTNVRSPEATKVKPTRTITKVDKNFFTDSGGSSSIDRQAINSKSTWEVEWKDGLLSLIVEAKEAGKEQSWKCTLKAISIEGISSTGYDLTEFERQKRDLENALNDEENKKQFVANCSNARLTVEKPEGKESAIELETEQAGSWNKFKFKESEEYFKRLWTENFYGIDRMEKEDEWFLDKDNSTHWSIKTEEEAKTKIKITATLNKNGKKEWKCNISRDSTKEPGRKTFKDDKLAEILGLSTFHYNKLEKKKYILRNCRKNNWEIKGLKIKVDGSNWGFDENSLKKISEGMYENPTEI